MSSTNEELEKKAIRLLKIFGAFAVAMIILALCGFAGLALNAPAGTCLALIFSGLIGCAAGFIGGMIVAILAFGDA